jgi:hypothetical protein
MLIYIDNDILLNSYVPGIIGSLIAGFLSIGIIETYRYFKIKIQHRKFNKIFGYYKTEKLYLVLPSLQIRSEIQTQYGYPLMKYGGAYIRSSKLLAYADAVSLKYLIDLVSKIVGSKSIISTDEDLKNELDLSFISFGGSNFYCTYILSQSDNKFYSFDGNKIINNQTSKEFEDDGVNDYGFVIKYKHINFPKKTWIIIAGLGETGTRGAAWFLATNWKKLAEKYSDNSFGFVVKVTPGIDGTAILVDENE